MKILQESANLDAVEITNDILQQIDEKYYQHIKEHGDEYSLDIKKMIFIRLIYELICENEWTPEELLNDFETNFKLALQIKEQNKNV